MIKVPRSVFILELKEEAVKMVIEGGPDRPGGMPQIISWSFNVSPPGEAGKKRGNSCGEAEPGNGRRNGNIPPEAGKC